MGQRFQADEGDGGDHHKGPMNQQDKLCHWCGKPWSEFFAPFCSQEHFEEMENAITQEAEAEEMKSGPGTPPIAKREQLKLWAKYINHQYAAQSALFEMITGYKPPKIKEMLAIISGH